MTCATILRIRASVACASSSVQQLQHIYAYLFSLQNLLFILLYVRQQASAVSPLCMCVCVFE
jgi:hypothetical protein